MTAIIYSITGIPINFSYKSNEYIPENTIIGQLKVLSNNLLIPSELAGLNQNIIVDLNWGDNITTILNDPNWFEVQNNSSVSPFLNNIIIKMPSHNIFTKYYNKAINYNLNFKIIFNFSTIQQLNFSSQAIIFNPLFKLISPQLINSINNIIQENTILASFELDDKFINELNNFSCLIDWGDGSENKLGYLKINHDDRQQIIYNVLNNNLHEYPNINKTYNLTIRVDNFKGEIITLFNSVTIKAFTTNNYYLINPQPVNFKATKNIEIKKDTIIGQFKIESDNILSVSNFFSTGGSIIIDWGDNITDGVTFFTNNLFSSNNLFIIKTSNLSHIYKEFNKYNVLIKVKYNDFETTIASFCYVEDTNLIALPNLIINLITFKLNKDTLIGSFNEINSDKIDSKFTVLIDWGDGSPLSLGYTQRINNTQKYSIYTNNDHYYSENLSYKLKIIVTTLNYTELIINPIVKVNVDLLKISKPIQGILINVPNLTICKKEKFYLKSVFTDISNSLAPYDITIIWGDETQPELNVIPTQINTSNQFLINNKHKYKNCGVYLVTVIINQVKAIGLINVINCDCECD
jgi:hypothetical protein